MFANGLAFLAGTFSVCQLSSLAPVSALVPALSLALLFLSWRRCLASAFLVAGALWAWQFGSAALAHGLDPALNGKQWLVTGEIASVPQSGADHASFDLDVRDAPPQVAVLRRLRLAWYDSEIELHAGERWQVLVRLKHAHGLRNPGGGDFEGRLFEEGIDATGYVVRCVCNRRTDSPAWRAPVLKAREWIANRIAESLPESRNVGILQDLAVGLDGRVTAEQWRTFSATGTTHLMAISGFHVAGVALAAMAMVRFVWRRLPAAGIAQADAECIVGLGAACGYALLAGMSVPTERTLVTLACLFAARYWRRATSIWSLLGVALIGVLLLDPLAPLGAGFWLSFGTVAGILFALEGRLARRSEWRELLPAQFAATLCLLPLTLALFGTVSVIGPLINLIAIPVFSLLLVPAILVGVLVLLLPPACGVLWFGAIDRAIEWAWPSFEALGASGVAQMELPARPVWTLALLAVAILWMLTPWPLRWRWLGLGLAVPALLAPAPLPESGDFEGTVLEVGQGLSVYVATREHRLLFDTGPQSQSGRAAAEFSVLPFLRERGTRTLDALVLSHGDRDHTGGARAIRERLEIRALWMGGARPQPDAKRCHAGDAWTWDGVRFEFLNPAEGDAPHGKENDASCVLRVSSPEGIALLTGDIEALAERAMLSRGGIGRVDVVVVPHHGSRSSSGVDFVVRLAPKWAVASVGYENRWQFPKESVVSRWQAAGARVFSTARSGAVTFRFARSKRPAEPEEWRVLERRFWQVD